MPFAALYHTTTHVHVPTPVNSQSTGEPRLINLYHRIVQIFGIVLLAQSACAGPTTQEIEDAAAALATCISQPRAQEEAPKSSTAQADIPAGVTNFRHGALPKQVKDLLFFSVDLLPENATSDDTLAEPTLVQRATQLMREAAKRLREDTQATLTDVSGAFLDYAADLTPEWTADDPTGISVLQASRATGVIAFDTTQVSPRNAVNLLNTCLRGLCKQQRSTHANKRSVFACSNG
jgi:hypothetical protein